MSNNQLFFSQGVPEDIAQRVQDRVSTMAFHWCVLDYYPNYEGVPMVVFTMFQINAGHQVFWHTETDFRNMSDGDLHARLMNLLKDDQ